MSAPPQVILTHSPQALQGLASRLESLGFSVVHHPLVRIHYRQAIDRTALARSHWCFFTSQNAVAAAHALKLFPLSAQVAAVGDKTAAALQAHGQAVALCANRQDAQGLVQQWLRHHAKQDVQHSVALLVGSRSLPTIPQALRAAGVPYRSYILYDSLPQPWQLSLAPGTQAIIILASPSAVQALPQQVGDCATLLTIGRTSQQAAQARGWHSHCALPPYQANLVALVQMSAKALAKH